MRDGLLDACVFPNVNWLTLFRCAPRLLIKGTLPRAATANYRSESLTLTSASRVPFEVDGEFAGLPARDIFHAPHATAVIVPPISGSDKQKRAGDFATRSA